MKLRIFVLAVLATFLMVACEEDSPTQNEETKNSFSQYSVQDTFRVTMDIVNGARTQTFNIPTQKNMKKLQIKIPKFEHGLCTLKVYNNSKMFWQKNISSQITVHTEFLSLQPTKFVLQYDQYTAEGEFIFTWF